MKKSLCLALILLIAGPVMFVAGGFWVDREKDNVVITTTTLYGNPEEAAGIRLHMVSQWQDQLIWETEYTLGSGETVSSFSFSSWGENWPKTEAAMITADCIVHWGTVGVGPGDNYSSKSAFNFEKSYLSRAVKAVMDRTEPGERRTETVLLRDYYEYYPLQFHLQKHLPDGYSLQVYYDESEGYFTDYFQVPVGDDIEQIILEKDFAGEVIDVQCEGLSGASFQNVYAFGEDGCYHAFYLERWGDEEMEEPGETFGIYYYPYIEEWGHSGRLTIDPEQARIVSSLEAGIELVDMALNESQDRLYLVTKEENVYYLNVYEADKGSLALSQKLPVRSDLAEKDDGYEPRWAQMSVQENGVLQVWQDGSFVFAVSNGDEMEIWEPEQFPSIQSFVFPSENVWSFDGQRLALASFVDWSSTSVNVAVYTRAGLVWYGICEAWYDVGEHSSDFGGEQEISTFQISPPGSVIGNQGYRPRNIPVEEILEIWWEQ